MTARQSPLTGKEKAFCRHYLTLEDAKAAVIKAGYSKRGAKEAGSRLLRKPAIQAELNHLRQQAATQVNRMLTKASEGVQNGVPAVLAGDSKVLVDTILDRSYANLALIEAVEIGLGRRKGRLTVSVSKEGEDGEVVTEDQTREVYMVNLGAAVRAAELLHKELGRLEGSDGAHLETDDPEGESVDRAILAFQKAIEERAERERRMIDVSPKRVVTPRNGGSNGSNGVTGRYGNGNGNGNGRRH